MEEWVCRVLMRMTRSGRQYVWAQGQWNLVLDTWPCKGHCDTTVRCQSHIMMLQWLCYVMMLWQLHCAMMLQQRYDWNYSMLAWWGNCAMVVWCPAALGRTVTSCDNECNNWDPSVQNSYWHFTSGTRMLSLALDFSPMRPKTGGVGVFMSSGSKGSECSTSWAENGHCVWFWLIGLSCQNYCVCSISCIIPCIPIEFTVQMYSISLATFP